MYAARNLVNARNVSADPTGNYYASATMMDKFTDAYIIAGALHHFSMDSINDEPKSHCYTGEIGNAEQMRNHLMTEAEQFIASHVDIDIKPLPEYGPSCNTFNCRYCGRTCTGSKKLRKHESTAHNHPDPVYGVAENQASTGTSQISSEKELDAASVSDKIYAYTKHALTVGLLRLNHNDAIALGDGKRIMLVNLYLCMLYKHNSCPKYAFGILETICQSKILLSERMAHRLIWNRVVNHRGDQDTNHPNDLDMEHCNKIFKDQAHSFRGVFTEKTVARVSRSALSAHRVVKNFDRETDTRTASGKHTITDTTSDVQMIVDQLMQQQVYIERQGRKHNSFPNVTANPYDGLDMETVRDWLSKSLKNYAVKSFY